MLRQRDHGCLRFSVSTQTFGRSPSALSYRDLRYLFALASKRLFFIHNYVQCWPYVHTICMPFCWTNTKKGSYFSHLIPPPIAPLVSSLFQPTEFDILISDNSVQIRTVSTRSENPIKTALRSVWSFLGVSFNTVPQVVWLTMTLSRRFGLGSRHPLPTPFTFRRWTVWDPWLRACQVVS